MSQQLVTFNPTEVASYGNQILNVIASHEEAKDVAENALRQADEREKIIDFELTRVALHLQKSDQIDLFDIYQSNKHAIATLYRQFLVETGVLQRIVDDKADRIDYVYTDAAIGDKYEYSEELKATDEEEYRRRRSRRNALNMRLARVCKAAIELANSGATADDMKVETNDAGELSAVITKGPKEIMGEAPTIQIHSKSVSPVEGASVTPTITGLAKLSDKRNKPEKPASKQETETSNRKDTTQDFSAIINAALMVVKGLEGEATKQQQAQLNSLLTEIQKCVK